MSTHQANDCHLQIDDIEAFKQQLEQRFSKFRFFRSIHLLWLPSEKVKSEILAIIDCFFCGVLEIFHDNYQCLLVCVIIKREPIIVRTKPLFCVGCSLFCQFRYALTWNLQTIVSVAIVVVIQIANMRSILQYTDGICIDMNDECRSSNNCAPMT